MFFLRWGTQVWSLEWLWDCYHKQHLVCGLDCWWLTLIHMIVISTIYSVLLPQVLAGWLLGLPVFVFCQTPQTGAGIPQGAGVGFVCIRLWVTRDQAVFLDGFSEPLVSVFGFKILSTGCMWIHWVSNRIPKAGPTLGREYRTYPLVFWAFLGVLAPLWVATFPEIILAQLKTEPRALLSLRPWGTWTWCYNHRAPVLAAWALTYGCK